MKTFRFFSMAALALMMDACSEEVNEIVDPQPVPTPGVINFSGTVTTKDGDVTRTAMTEQSDKSMKVEWEVDDLVYLYQGGVDHGNASVKSLNGDGSAIIRGTVNNESGGTYDLSQNFEVNYFGGRMAKMYLDEVITQSQEGTLAGLGGYDYRKGSAKLKEDPKNAGKYIIDGAVNMVSQIAIWKLTLKDGNGDALNVTETKPVTIKSGDDVIAATGSYFQGGTTNVVYLAMYPVDNKTVSVTYNDGTDEYSFSKAGVSLAAGKFYQSEVTLTKLKSETITINAGGGGSYSFVGTNFTIDADYALSNPFGGSDPYVWVGNPSSSENYTVTISSTTGKTISKVEFTWKGDPSSYDLSGFSASKGTFTYNSTKGFVNGVNATSLTLSCSTSGGSITSFKIYYND